MAIRALFARDYADRYNRKGMRIATTSLRTGFAMTVFYCMGIIDENCTC